MAYLPEADRDELATKHARRRRLDNRRWLIVIVITLLGGAIGWLVTANTDWIIVFGFLAVYPLMILIYTHFYLLNPRADPGTIQQRLETWTRARQTGPVRVARANGLLLLVASPFFLALGVVKGAEQHGAWGAVVGSLLGVFCIAVGATMFAWSKRRASESFLRYKRRG
jgi:uncharacterized membrane protein YfcA